jgi:hypothetical protein
MKKIVKLVNVKIFSEFNNNAEFNKIEIEPDIQFGFINELSGSWSKYLVNDLFKTVKPTAQDKSFYRYPKLTLPRDKFSIIKEKYNSTITRKKDTADYKIISDKFVSGLYEGSWSKYKSYDDFVKFWDKVNYLFNDDCKDLINKLIEKGNHTYVYNISGINGYYNYANYTAKQETVIKFIKNHIDNENDKSHFYIKDLELFKELYISNNLVLDEDVLDFATEDSVVLDEDAFKNLESMCTSEDSANLAIALEMMANCNIKKSYDIIAYMFWFYTDHIRYAKNWQSVNVKSLKKVFSKYERSPDHRRSHGYKMLIRNLLKDSACTEFIKDKIKNKYFNMVIKHWITEQGPFDVSIESLVFKDLDKIEV